MKRGRAMLAALGLFWASAGMTVGAEGPAGAKVDFDRDIAPLLAEHCLDCHGGPKPKGGLDLASQRATFKGGDGGPALRGGDLDESLLWQKVADDEMPPKKPLADSEKALIRDWIASGAKWGTDPIDPFRLTTRKRAGYDWWSLKPIQSPTPPSPKDASWARNPIDQFVLAKLEAAGLGPSQAADRRTLIRRLSFDLIGLPPTPEEVEAFVADQDVLAYERLVDRLLASPHYGERWARHWMDVARFGESDGFERNTSRASSWHYRNWLIDALNADMPYDEFCRLQVAGDVLRPGDAEASKATGFLVAGVHNTVLGNDMMRAVARQDELEDIVGTVGQTFLGLTVNCARCHDHKFDPIAQADFYRLASALGGVEHGEKEFPVERMKVEVARLTAELAKVGGELGELERPVRRTILALRGKEDGLAIDPPTPISAWDFRAGTRDRVGGLDLKAKGNARVGAEGVVLDGKDAYLESGPISGELREKTLEAWVKLGDLAQRGGGLMSLERPDGSAFDAIVFGELEPGRWMAGSENFRRYASFGGEGESIEDAQPVHLAIAYHADGSIVAYRNGQPYGRSYRSTGAITYPAGQAVVLFGCRHSPAGGNRLLAGTIVQARLYNRALAADEVAASAATGGDFIDEATLVAHLTPELRSRREALKGRQKRLSDERAECQARSSFKAYVTLSGPSPVTRLLLRGQVTDPAGVVAPGGVLAVGGTSANFGLAPEAPEVERRRKLADWLTSPANPLFARVMANRIWHYHFGTGLVETPNDFGFNGGRPSHPELLDWLASEFAAEGFHLKALHRLIVTSAAYRQRSAPDAKGLARDADNRLLWRRSPRRVEGEAVRDAILEVSGLLNRELDGRGFTDYHETFLNGTTYFDPFDPVGPEFHRRSVYRFLPRGANQGLLDTFDCPDPAAAAPRRSMTTTPIQALALWNNDFVFRMAEALTARVSAEVPGPDRDPSVLDRRIARAWQLAFQRDPRPSERGPARDLVATYGFRALGRALFNANEFLTVE